MSEMFSENVEPTSSLQLLAVNINVYHWRIHQPITIDFQYVRRLLAAPLPLLYGPITEMKGTIPAVLLPYIPRKRLPFN